MKNIIIEILDDEGKVKELYNFRSLKDVTKHDKFKDIKYISLREVYLYHTGKRKANHHDFVKQLVKKIRIKDAINEIPF